MPVRSSNSKFRTRADMRRLPSADPFTAVVGKAAVAFARSTSVIRIPARWYRQSALLKSGLAFGAFVIHLGVIGHWWLWCESQTPLHVPILWTVGLVLLVITWPQGRMRDIAGFILAGYVFYGVKGIFLDHLMVVGGCMLVGSSVLFGVLVATAPPGYFKSF